MATEITQAAREAGRKAAFNWFCQQGESLAVHRDVSRAEWCKTLYTTRRQEFFEVADVIDAYTTGYSEGVADLIGGRNA